MKPTLVYALIDPRNNQCRYIGKSVNVNERYSEHCRAHARDKTYRAKWIRQLKPLKPKIIIIEEVFDNWVESEKFWIAYFKSLGCNLTNLTFGGEGSTGAVVSQHTRSKRSESLKGRVSPMKGRKQTPETKLKISAALTGKKKSEQHSANISKGQIGKIVPIEVREKISTSTKLAMNAPEMFKRMSEARKGKSPYNKGIKKGKGE